MLSSFVSSPLLAVGAAVALASSSNALTIDLVANSTGANDVLSSTTFDYVVVGGGTAGLAVASRLSADNSSLNILVLEAGQSGAGNAGIDIPGFAGSTFGSSVDWGFSTTPQTNADDRSVYWPRGKVLGGSSALNFLVYCRPALAELNLWSSLFGNSGWTWSSLLSYFQKSEHFYPPTGNTQNQSVAYSASSHGTSGPVSNSYAPYLAPQFDAFFDSVQALGVPVATDLSSGNNHGISLAPSTINTGSETRSYAIEYLNIAPNLYVFTSAQATQINWSSAKNGSKVIASGVNFATTGTQGSQMSVNATREIILSAGAVQTPQLLELSGVGNPSIINPLGISTVVNLPGVGENLQDHPAHVNVYKLKPGVESLDSMSNSTLLNEALGQYANGQGILTEALYPLAYLALGDFTNSSDQRTIANLGSQASNPQLSSQQYTASEDLYNANVPVLELLGINVYFGNSTAEADTTYISLAGCLQHELSRGTIHINSASPFAAPSINPNYLQSPLDTFLLAKSGMFLREVAAQPALAQYIESEAEPGPSVQTLAEWESWVQSVVRTEFHPVGTAAMTSQSNGGVVNNNLIVYGTQNVRVVDLSILPIHVSAHPQSLAYAIGEKAAALLYATQY
ncbi:hypothetical protein JCM5296_001885 [Sporobolomyces johnsonii]